MRFDKNGVPVYAVIITGKEGRLPFLKNAIASFACQSYPNRYCIVVNDGDYKVGNFGLPEDRLLSIELGNRKILGELRNEALNHVPTGAVWVQWDDDDWHHPHLIEHQLRYMLENNADACLLRNQVKVSLAKNSAWEHRLPYRYFGFAGSIMMHHKPDIRYPAWPKKEDSEFLLRLLKSSRIMPWDNPIHYYFRFILPDSTSGPFHFKLFSKRRNQWQLDPFTFDYLKEIDSHYQFAGLNPSIVSPMI
ncbi:MAG: glycosyltransferase family A protein [bacterium]